MSVRSVKDIKRSLLKRAFKEGRGSEMILLLQWIKAQARHEKKKLSEEFIKFEEENMGQPRAVRMLNKLAQIDGREDRYTCTKTAYIADNVPDSLN